MIALPAVIVVALVLALTGGSEQAAQPGSEPAAAADGRAGRVGFPRASKHP